MPDKYDLIVVGGGPGGLEAAARTAALGRRVLIIEKEGWGGTCTHRGCIPTKALLTCSKYYTDLKKFKRLGITVASAAFDFAAMKKHQQQIVKVAALGAQKMIEEARVELKAGTGEILNPEEVKLTDASGNVHIFFTGSIVIAWGSQPQILPGINLSERILTSDGILNLSILPRSIVIVGGSFIGIEFATLFAELGVKVTLIELLERILPLEDEEAADFLRQELTRAGIAVHNSTQLTGLKETADGVVIQAQKKTEQLEWNADYVLLCTGRKPQLREVELRNCGITYDRLGIKVNKNMLTNVPGIYAVGDVTGGMMLAHRATQQGKVAAANICRSDAPPYNERYIPSVVYSHPQIAHVGLNYQQARDEGLPCEIVKSNYSANIIARAELTGQGFVKAVFCGEKIIGATAAGDQAAELIVPLTLAVSGEMTKKQLQAWVIPHPTLSEILAPLF
ncbi:MAG: dihydrolipoyl dehydrogenase [Deltaproteobacteria bacterium HGW-Deltaproteobacteria-12]|jgi:dihydrolipoamide dehydrogenase|nr:MAG: dihydrolipoyl dehydrogenase [Deltaproteobacteria bacterium HGW-Deltaproteobacteria-12]